MGPFMGPVRVKPSPRRVLAAAPPLLGELALGTGDPLPVVLHADVDGPAREPLPVPGDKSLDAMSPRRRGWMRLEVRAHGFSGRLRDLAHGGRRAGRATLAEARGEALEDFGPGLRRVPGLDAHPHALRVGLDLLVLGVAR